MTAPLEGFNGTYVTWVYLPSAWLYDTPWQDVYFLEDRGTLQDLWHQALSMEPYYILHNGTKDWDPSEEKPPVEQTAITEVKCAGDKGPDNSTLRDWTPAAAHALSNATVLFHGTGARIHHDAPGPNLCALISCVEDSAVWFCNHVSSAASAAAAAFVSSSFFLPSFVVERNFHPSAPSGSRSVTLTLTSSHSYHRT